MKVTFKPEGGFGFFPGLNKPLELNCETLPEPEAHHLQEMLKDACFFDLPSQAPENSRGADLKHYTIQVEDKGQAHSVAFSDTDTNAALHNLVSYLSKKQKESRAGL